MKVGIIGAGAVGMLFAFYLQKAGAAVTLYTRTEEQAEHIRHNGITCTCKGETTTEFPAVASLATALPQEEYLFVAVKQYDLPSLVSLLKETPAAIIFLQNGMTHLSLLQELKGKAAAVGIVEHGAKREAIGIVTHTGIGVTRLGILTGQERFADLLPLFKKPDFPLLVEDGWREIVIGKLIVNACINPLTALYRVRNGALLQNPYFYEAMQQVFQEVITVLGEDETHWERVCTVCQNTANNQSSMLTDILLERKTEIDAIVGYLLIKAKECNIQAPLLSFLHQSIKGLES